MSKQGKKKAVIKMSLGEFHSATPLPQESAAPQPSLNWADEMEKLDDTGKPADFTFDRSQLPTATKAALEPDVDLAQVPSKPPFTAHLSNISFEADEVKIRGFFVGCNILNLRLPIDDRGTYKGHGYIDFAERESLINALKKNGVSFFNRPIRVQLESDHKKRQLRDGQTELRSDEADWRRPHLTEEPTRSFGEQRGGRGGYQSRDGQQRENNRGYQQRESGQGYQQRESGQGYQQRQYGQGYQQREHGQGYQQREQGQGYQQREQGQGYQQRDQGYQRKQFSSGYRQHRASENAEQADSQSVSSATSTPTTSMTERPKLNLAPRSAKPEENVPEAEIKPSSSIFGSAKPVNTAAREREIEEKLKKDRLEAERLEKEKREREQEKEETGAHHDEPQAEEPEERNEEEEFQVVGSSGKPRVHNKNDNNNNTIRNQNRPNNYTSPQQRYKKPESSAPQAEAPKENVWKTKPAAALFSTEPSQAEGTDSQRTRPQDEEHRRSYPVKRTEYQNRDRQNRDGNRDNRDNKDRRFSDRNKPINKNPRGERQYNNEAKPVRPRNEGFVAPEQPSGNKNELGFVNKFSKLAVDVEDVEFNDGQEE